MYAVYLRKSRADLDAEAMGQGESIDARPKMKQILREVEQGRWAGVLCMDIDRLARGNSADQARAYRFRKGGTFYRKHAAIWFPKGSRKAVFPESPCGDLYPTVICCILKRQKFL